MKHLQCHHPRVHKATLELNQKRTGDAEANTPKLCVATLNGVKMSAPALQLNCLRLITENGLAFKFLDYAAFQDIVTPLLDAMPAADRITISSRAIPPKIKDFAEIIRQKIAKEVEGKMLSLKVDGVTKGNRHFVGINAQYTLNDKVVVRTLAVEEILEASTATNLRTLVTIVLKRFRIDTKQIVSFTSDSGANYVLAGKLLDFVVSEEGGDPEVNLDAPAESPWADANMELYQGDFSIQSIRCAAHTLHLAVEDALKEEVGVQDLLKAVRKLAKYLLNESQARQIKAAKLPLPALDVPTRWGSTYDLMASVLNLKNYVEMTLVWHGPGDQVKYNLTDAQWAQLEVVLKDLRPARKATTQLQREDMTLGEFLSIWKIAVMALERKTESSLAKTLLRIMDDRTKAVAYRDASRGNRVSPLFDYPGFYAAVFMDPRYFSLLSAEQVQEAKTFLLDLQERLQAVRGPALVVDDTEEKNNVERTGNTDSEDEGAAAFARLLESRNKEHLVATGAPVAGARPQPRATKRAALLALLDEYQRTTAPLPLAASVMDFWKNKKFCFPELYDLATIVLSIPATQVSVERLFSALRFILRPQRFGLSAEHVDAVAFLHANSTLVQEEVKNLLKVKKKKKRRTEDKEDDVDDL